MNPVRARVFDLSPPAARPNPDGSIRLLSVVRFPDKEYEDFVVDQWNPKGYPYDDLGRIKQVISYLHERGLAVVPSSEVTFSTMTAEEAAVLTENFYVIERTNENE